MSDKYIHIAGAVVSGGMMLVILGCLVGVFLQMNGCIR